MITFNAIQKHNPLEVVGPEYLGCLFLAEIIQAPIKPIKKKIKNNIATIYSNKYKKFIQLKIFLQET